MIQKNEIFHGTMVPLYLGLARLKVLVTDFGTYASLILPVAANAFGLYLLTQFFQNIPDDGFIIHN